jgi:hypothetical protein
MNEINILITGMILLMAPVAYDNNPAHKTIHSAVAVDATSPQSKYGLDIPVHAAALLFDDGDIDSDKTIDLSGRLESSNGTRRVGLHGDRLQLGNFNNDKKQCEAIKDDPDVNNPKIHYSIRSLPRMDELVTKPVLDEGTYPVSGDFEGIDPDRVASWFEIPIGVVSAIHSPNPADDVVTFPSVHKKAVVAPTVRWHIKKNNANCLLVTPFDGPERKRIDIVFKPDNTVSIRYENKADMSSGMVMPGVGIDFELLYGLYKELPTMPPLPFDPKLLVHHKPEEVHQDVNHHMDITSVTTGVNCGPATIPNGG